MILPRRRFFNYSNFVSVHKVHWMRKHFKASVFSHERVKDDKPGPCNHVLSRSAMLNNRLSLKGGTGKRGIWETGNRGIAESGKRGIGETGMLCGSQSENSQF